jgi:hypothetical protein
MNLNATRLVLSSKTINGPLLALFSTAIWRNGLLPESIAALVWEFLHESVPESVEKTVSRQVGA